ncbi:DUF6301 family protein [Actinoplanes sp. GCM10030250]|uniref:DUF6301 family protein n=1 Tax=Actinoplanes sp. GCM10030250 TaxID=3273376 RepID=UPI003622BC57
MTTWLQAGPEAIRSLLTDMKAHRGPWQTDDVHGLSRRMGWTLNEVIEGEIATGHAGFGVRKNEIVCYFHEGLLDHITVGITENVREDGTDRDRFMWDAFADTAAEGVAVLGEPTDRDHTEPPTVRWRLEDSTILVKNLESAVTVTWASNRFQDEWDQIVEALA